MARGASIINLASTAFHIAPAQMSAYVATKGGIVGFTRSLARELAAPDSEWTRFRRLDHDRAPTAGPHHAGGQTPHSQIAEHSGSDSTVRNCPGRAVSGQPCRQRHYRAGNPGRSRLGLFLAYAIKKGARASRRSFRRPAENIPPPKLNSVLGTSATVEPVGGTPAACDRTVALPNQLYGHVLAGTILSKSLWVPTYNLLAVWLVFGTNLIS